MRQVLLYNNEGHTIIGLISGVVGGMGNFFLQIHTTPFWLNILQAGCTALLCGAAGVAGKEGYQAVKKIIKQRREKSARKNR